MSAPDSREELDSLFDELNRIRSKALEFERRFASEIEQQHAAFRASTKNLLHYLALRSFDLRPLQTRLARRGLSSLGRSEAHVMATLNAVLGNIGAMAGRREEIEAQQRELVCERPLVIEIEGSDSYTIMRTPGADLGVVGLGGVGLPRSGTPLGRVGTPAPVAGRL